MQRYSMPSAGLYDAIAGRLFGGRYQAIAREIATEAPPNASILDAGCGPGEVLVRLAKLAPSLDLTGLDLDAPMIDRARERAVRAVARGAVPGRSAPTFVVGDVMAMPFEDASFDLVVSSFSVHHWPDPHAGLAEVMRVLKPGGRAIVWDIASPTGRPAVAGAGHGQPAPHRQPAPHGEPAPGQPTAHVISGNRTGGPKWFQALRMLLQFLRATPQRFEFVKAPTPAR